MSTKIKKKPRIWNWLFTFFIVCLLGWSIYQQFFVLHSGIPFHSPAYMVNIASDDLIVSVERAGTNASDGVFGGSTLANILSGRETEQATLEIETIKSEISQLKLQKQWFEDNIERLNKENEIVANINLDMRNKVLELFDKGAWKHTIMGAIIGAVVSAAMTFILERPVVKDKIDKFFFLSQKT